MAARVERAGVSKVHLPVLPLLALSILAGVFIAFGGMFYTLAITGSGFGFGPSRLLGGVAFSVGLVLVIVGGAELFTGNSLIVMAWASRRITLSALLRNWGLVYAGNFAGALGMVALVYLSGILSLDMGGFAETARSVAKTKLELPVDQAFVRGVLCNALVCLSVWLCYGARDVASKILSIVGPITAFVALGLEHSVANMYLIPIGMLAGTGFDPAGLARNLFWVTLGNIVGGAVGWHLYIGPSISALLHEARLERLLHSTG